MTYHGYALLLLLVCYYFTFITWQYQLKCHTIRQNQYYMKWQELNNEKNIISSLLTVYTNYFANILVSKK